MQGTPEQLPFNLNGTPSCIMKVCYDDKKEMQDAHDLNHEAWEWHLAKGMKDASLRPPLLKINMVKIHTYKAVISCQLLSSSGQTIPCAISSCPATVAGACPTSKRTSTSSIRNGGKPRRLQKVHCFSLLPLGVLAASLTLGWGYEQTPRDV